MVVAFDVATGVVVCEDELAPGCLYAVVREEGPICDCCCGVEVVTLSEHHTLAGARYAASLESGSHVVFWHPAPAEGESHWQRVGSAP